MNGIKGCDKFVFEGVNPTNKATHEVTGMGDENKETMVGSSNLFFFLLRLMRERKKKKEKRC